MRILLMAAALLLFTNAAQSHKLCAGFLPPNDMKIPVGDKSVRGMSGGNGITESQYNEIMDRIQKIYGPIVQQQGGNLVINRLWNDATVNASAQRQGNSWIINMYGGIARHPDTSYEGQALIACHEIGHHLGGAPKISAVFGGNWASNEGAADYFATLKCLRLVFGQDDNSKIIGKTNIDPVAKSNCLSQFPNQQDQDLCMRISMSDESAAYLFQALKKDSTRPKFDTPDKSEVARTDDNHPATQCRMDTYFAGTICPVAVSAPLSDTDFKAGSCVQGVDPIGWRPRCWFSPNSGGGGGGGGGGNPGDCPLGNPQMCEMICQLDPSQPFCKK